MSWQHEHLPLPPQAYRAFRDRVAHGLSFHIVPVTITNSRSVNTHPESFDIRMSIQADIYPFIWCT